MESTYELITKEFLLEEYINKKRSMKDIARQFNCSTAVIDNRLKKFEIPKNSELNDNLKNDIVKKITKEEFSELFLNQSLTYKEIAQYFGCSERQLKRLNSEKFKIKRNDKERKEFSNRVLESNNISRNDLLSNAREKFKEKYEVENPSNVKEIQEKRKKYFQTTYGVDNPFQLDNVKEKIKTFYIKNYGVTNPSQVESLKKKTALSISLSKLEDHVESEHLKIFTDKSLLEDFVNSLDDDNKNYTSLGKLLNIDDTTIARYIKNYSLEGIIKSKKSTSSYELEIEEFIKSFGFEEIERNNKTILDGKEIDIYIPKLKIGIEFNGNYWHSELEKTEKYHQEKSLLAESKGIFLYHIFEYEWEEKKEKIKNHLSHLISESERIPARKCRIGIIDKETKKKFLDDYHLQGNDNSIYDYGLFYNDELVEVMTFCKARFTKGHEWELSRLCTKSGTTVMGGANRLFKHFVNNIMKSGESIVTYNDIGKSKGNVYKLLRFKKIRTSKPNYIWYRSHFPILTRYQTQIKDEIKTMHSKGYTRIFDSGNNVWSYTKI